MRKILSVLTVLALILTLLTPVISAQSVPELPESTPLIIEHAINSGKIEYNDDIALKLELYDRLYSALINLEDTINVFDLSLKWSDESIQKISDCHSYTVNNNPILYYILNPAISYSSVSYDNGVTWYVNEIKIDYTDYDLETVKNQISTAKKLVSDIAKKVPNNISVIAKMLYVHDYLAVNFEYDMSGQYRTVYDFLIKKSGVCSAYAHTFTAIMNELGIPVTSAYSDEGNHQWNIVLLNNRFYHIDCTWADPVPDSYGVAKHNFFLLSDSQLDLADSQSENAGSHINYYTPETHFGLNISCTDTTYDSGYIWNNSDTAFAYYKGAFYNIADISYADSIGNIIPQAVIFKTEDFKSKQNIITLNSSDIWWTPDKTGYFPGFHTGFTIIGSQLYFNDSNSVKYFDLSNSHSGTVFTSEDTIYSFNYLGSGSFGYMTRRSDLSLTKNTTVLTDMGQILNNGTESLNDDIAAMRKYLLGNHDDNICLVKGDLSGDDCEINILDFVALKKLAAQGL